MKIVLLLLSAAAAWAQSRAVAVTVDDLPYASGLVGGTATRSQATESEAVNREILSALTRHHVPVTGFVIQKRAEELGLARATKILRNWTLGPFDLANHTYSHQDSNRLSIEQIEEEITRGEAAYSSLMKLAGKQPRFFRFPMNHTGDTREKHDVLAAFLKSRGYQNAACTIENSDYLFNRAYVRMLSSHDEEAANKLRRQYIAYTGAEIDYYAGLNKQVLGYEPAEIMLLHDDRLNADTIDQVLALFEARHYEFVTLSEAESQPAYQVPDTYISRFGPMWGYRWASELGIKVNGALEPEPPEWILKYDTLHPRVPDLALVGGTVVDVSNFGDSARDIANSVVIVAGGKLAAVGARGKIAIPKGARIVDVSGKFIVPGLIDGFAGLNSQSQANANLYMGVTTVVASGDDRRGLLFLDGSPSPHTYLLDSVGSSDEFALLGKRPEWAAQLKGRDQDVELSWEDTSRIMDEQARMGIRALWLGHNLTAENTRRIIAKARQLGMATYGEFIATPYSEAIDSGVSLLLHMSRFELGLIPAESQRALIADPEGPAAGKAYRSVDAMSAGDARLPAYGRLIARNRVALMPTFSLFYADLPGHRNLWKEPVASILDPKAIFHPTDPSTGEAYYPSEDVRKRAEQRTEHLWALNEALFREHPRYLAASGSAVFGSMPGISMHTELELLVRLGLTPREALAAATGNYAEQFGWSELGKVSAGRRADLLILDADPTIDIRNSMRIGMVVLNGAIVDRPALLTKPAPPN